MHKSASYGLNKFALLYTILVLIFLHKILKKKIYVLTIYFFNAFSFLSIMFHLAKFQFSQLQIRCKMTGGEVLHRIVMFKKCHRMTSEIYAMPDAILRERQREMPGSTCVSVRAGTCDTSPFFLLGRPSFLHCLMDFNESRDMSATNEGKVVRRQT